MPGQTQPARSERHTPPPRLAGPPPTGRKCLKPSPERPHVVPNDRCGHQPPAHLCGGLQLRDDLNVDHLPYLVVRPASAWTANSHNSHLPLPFPNGLTIDRVVVSSSASAKISFRHPWHKTARRAIPDLDPSNATLNNMIGYRRIRSQIEDLEPDAAHLSISPHKEKVCLAKPEITIERSQVRVLGPVTPALDLVH